MNLSFKSLFPGLPFQLICILLSLGFSQSSAYAWGERGHRLVTVVAARITAERLAKRDEDFAALWIQREHALAHLSNLPDIQWRNDSERVQRENAPTHYINLEYLYPNPLKKRPEIKESTDAFTKILMERCKKSEKICAKGLDPIEKINTIGHAPLRVLQFYKKMKRHLQDLKKEDPTKRQAISRHANGYFTAAGLMSHFIADLSNPMHTSMNYDGQLTKQKGLHHYFETAIVDSLDLGLGKDVYDYALKQMPQIDRLATKNVQVWDKIWSMTWNSFQSLENILQLDRKFSLQIAAAHETPVRKSAYQVSKHYHQTVVRHLGQGALTLSDLWIMAWLEAGSPKIPPLPRPDYPLMKAFIAVDYLN